MRNVIQIAILSLIGLTCGGIFTVFIVQVRAAAARSECANNLKQLALAVGNYHDSMNRFPTAGETNPDLPPEKCLSWIVGIFPFVEASNLYNKIDHKKSWDAEENRFAALFDIRIVRCPSYPGRQPVSTLAPSHYIGISGVGDNAIALTRDDPRAGFFGYDRPVKDEDLKRAFNETLLIVETSQAQGCWAAAGSPTTRGLVPDGSPYIGVGGQFGGNHRREVNVAFADGSIRYIEQSIDPAMCEAMATLSGKGNRE